MCGDWGFGDGGDVKECGHVEGEEETGNSYERVRVGVEGKELGGS